MLRRDTYLFAISVACAALDKLYLLNKHYSSA